MGSDKIKQSGSTKKPIWKRWWVWVVAITVIGLIAAPGGKKEKKATKAEAPSAQAKVEEAKTKTGPASSHPEFYKALMEGDLDKIEEMVGANPDLVNTTITRPGGANGKPGAKTFPLFILARGGIVEVENYDTEPDQPLPDRYTKAVEYLINKGADVNKRHEQTGGTALHEAAQNKFLPMVEVLVSNGADVNLRKKSMMTGEFTGSNCIGSAITQGVFPGGDDETAIILKYLIKHGAKVNLVGTGVLPTALHWAVDKKRIKSAKVLLENGADPHARKQGCSTCKSPMDIAKKHKKRGDSRLLDLLMAY